MLRKTSCGTGLSAKARGLQRSRISSWTGKSLGAGFCMSSTFPSALRYSMIQGSGRCISTTCALPTSADAGSSVTGFSGHLLDHFCIDGDIDVVADHHAAIVQSGVPFNTKVLAIDS